jgi:hypothetical protein
MRAILPPENHLRIEDRGWKMDIFDSLLSTSFVSNLLVRFPRPASLPF